MKKLLLLTIYGLLAISLFAQQNYQAAYIVNLEKDTVRGFVDYQIWNTNPEKINFKVSLEADAQQFSPNDIQSFMVNDERYISAIIDVENSDRTKDLIGFGSDLKIEKKYVFLSIIIGGDKSLASYKDQSRYTNFYILIDHEYQLLIYKKYYTKIEKKTIIKENRKYIGQLIVYLSDCEDIKAYTPQVDYTEGSLGYLFKKYYLSCRQNELIYLQKKRKEIGRFGVISGISISKLKFNSSTDYLKEAAYPLSIDFSLGAFYEILIRRGKTQWTINNEFTFTRYQVNAIHETYFKTAEVTFGENNFHLNIMARYHFQLKGMNFFANIGIVNTFVYSYTDQLIITAPNYHNVVIDQEALGYIQQLKLGTSAGIGARWNDFSLEYRYQSSNAFAFITKPTYWVNSSLVYLGYRF